jgi:hypothetical protein
VSSAARQGKGSRSASYQNPEEVSTGRCRRRAKSKASVSAVLLHRTSRDILRRDVIKGVIDRKLFSPSSCEKDIVATDENTGVLVDCQEK